MSFHHRTLRLAASAMLSLVLTGAAFADDELKWWPNAVEKTVDGKTETFDYTPRMDSVSKKWHVCVLLPHLKDTWWVGIGVGAMKEAQRQKIKASLFQAGGYTELNKQLSQFDDCVALGVNAILIAAISEEALKPKIDSARGKGIKVVAVGNPIAGVELDSAVFGDYNFDAEVAGKALVAHYEKMGKKSARVVDFAGVAGAGWAEQAVRGWENAFKGTMVELVEHKYGETGKSTQLKLVEDTLQTYDDIDAFVGVPTMAEVAPEALQEAGKAGKVDIVAFYMNEGALEGVKNGTVLGFASNPMVVEAAVAMDTAIRLLEGEQTPKRMRLPPVWIDKQFIETQDMSKFTPPGGWKVVYTVE